MDALKKVKHKVKNKDEKIKMTFDEIQTNEIPVIWSIIDFSSNVPLSVYADTTVVKTSETCYRGSMFSEESRLIGEEYLLNAKKSSIDISLPIGTFSYSSLAPRASLSFRNFIEEEVHEQNRAIKLPKFKNVTAPIGAVIRARRSIREFSDEKLTMKELSTVLYYGDGVSGTFDHNPMGSFETTTSLGDSYISAVRCAPSGGGLYPIYLYLVVVNVEGLEKGIYKYMPLTHSLEVIKVFDDKDFEEYLSFTKLGREIDVKKLGVGIYFVYNLYENCRKYDDMGLQFAMIEAGEIAENIHLICTAENLASTDIGGFEKNLTEQFFDIDSLTEHIIHLTLVAKR